jgi:hypothetical protein
MTQTIEYVVDVKGAQVAAGQVEKVEVAFQKTDMAARNAGASIDRATGPTRNLGQAALETSRGIEDLQYGIGGVVNNIPSLVMALGGSMGLTAVISLAAVGINQVVKNFGNVDPAAKEAASKAAEHVKGLRDEIAGLGRDLRALQVGAERAAMEMQGEAVGRAASRAREALAPLGGIERFERLQGKEGLPLTIREQMDAARKAMSELDDEAAKLAGMRRIQLEKESQRAIDLAVDTANGQEDAYQRSLKEGVKNAADAAKMRYDVYVAGLDAEDKALREVAESRRKDEEARLKQDAEIRDIFTTAESNMIDWVGKMREEAQDHRAKNELKAYDERRKLAEKEKKEQEKDAAEMQKKWDDFYMGFAELGAQGFGMVASAGQQYFDDIITGQEHAAEMMAISLMRTAGDALVGHGVNLLGASVVSLLTPGLQPLAAAQAGAGAGLVAAGMGLGAGATAASHVLAGGTIGQKLPDDKATKDKGASPRSSGGGGGGGPLIVNVSYGAGGPLPEDIAREIHKVTSSGNRRRGAA